ncbi:hypothetical protein FHW88_005166 [Mucilaginibacter sp. SG538B]|uniref:hypothetical protein n=1 Tax=Mucilaginibacter sp. SG538B TaxID=2587021 RepID=UPI00159E5FE3|nr:hypothetical protein [Mucilaginibacter sp. SG538B]NVM66848.1 hypothetical protein [Mucilaginibacter sp. SG538B]
MPGPEKIQYEERVTVFIDILGFKDLLAETVSRDEVQNQAKVQEIAGAYRIMRNVLEVDTTEKRRVDLKKDSRQITIFSDCVVISFKADQPDEIFFTLMDIQGMIIELAAKGILCRGAITHGALVHKPEMLFGPALVEAYLLESKAALYPRVILHRDIIRLAKLNSVLDSAEALRELLVKDSDGMYYVDYFSSAQDVLDDPEEGFPEYIRRLGDKIRRGLQGSSSAFKADVRVKYSWMKERYNQVVKQGQYPAFQGRLRKKGLDDAADAYMALKRINPYE